MKYLIVDDSSLGRKMLAKLLKDFIKDEDDIIFAVNGEEAVEIYKTEKPNVCFMDLTMPVMDGFEATEKIIEFDKDALIFTVSADIQREAIINVIKAGSVMFTEKPINSEKLTKIFTLLRIKGIYNEK